MENIVNADRGGLLIGERRLAAERSGVILQQVQDPHRFMVGDIAVRVRFAETDRTLSDCLLNAVSMS